MNRNAFRVPSDIPQSRMPEYQRQQLTASPGADVSARLSSDAGAIIRQGADNEARQLDMLGKGMQQAAKAGYDLYTDYQTSKAKDAWLQYKQDAEGLKAELATLTGKNAVDSEKGVSAQIVRFKENRARISKELGGMAAERFAQAAADVDSNLTNWGIGKAHGEAVNYGNEKSTALIQLRQNEALANADNPVALSAALKAVDDEIAFNMAPRNGWDDDIVKAKQQDVRQKTLVQAITDRIKGEQLNGAANLMRTYGPELGGALPGLKAQAAAQGRAMNARARAEAERFREDRLNSQYASVWDNIKNLPREEREQAAYEYIDRIAERKDRAGMLSMLSYDLAFQNKREDAADLAGAVNIVEKAKASGISPTAFKLSLDAKEDLSPKARRHAQDLFFGKITDNPENRQALDKIREEIDAGKYENKIGIEAAALNGMLTVDQTKSALKYYEHGGKEGSVRLTTVLSTWKSLTNSKAVKLPDGFYDKVLKKLPADPTEKDVEKAISRLVMDGDAGSYNASTGAWKDNILGSDSFADVVGSDKEKGWLPRVTDFEREAYAQELTGKGITLPADTDERKIRLRQYKKQKMGM